MTASRVAVARSSMQSGRLMRELSRCSLHESLAQELLLEVSEQEDVECAGVCVSVLERHMYFYSKEMQPGLMEATRRAVVRWQSQREEDSQRDGASTLASSSTNNSNHNSVASAVEDLCVRLQRWQSEMESRLGAPPASSLNSSNNNNNNNNNNMSHGSSLMLHTSVPAAVEARWQHLLRQRQEAVAQLRSEGYGLIASSSSSSARARSSSPPPGLTMRTRAASERTVGVSGGRCRVR